LRGMNGYGLQIHAACSGLHQESIRFRFLARV
jgi:hypothetical protein